MNSRKNGKAVAAVVAAVIFILGAAGVAAAKAKTDKESFLVASPQMLDPLFRESVILMLPRTEAPMTAGLIVNKPTGVPLSRIAPEVSALKKRSDVAYFGGPVDIDVPSIAFRSAHPSKGAIPLSGDIYLSLDPEFITDMLKSNAIPSDLRLYFGRAQWAPGQLQNEMHEGAWYVVEAAPAVIFNSRPKRLWRTLIDSMQMRSIMDTPARVQIAPQIVRELMLLPPANDAL